MNIQIWQNGWCPALLVLLSLSGPCLAASFHVQVDPTTKYQTIDAWAVYSRYWEDDKINNVFDKSFEPHVDELTHFLVNEVGINGARVEIWSGIENPTDHWLDHYNGNLSYEDHKYLRYEKINDNNDPFAADLSGFQFSRFDYTVETMVLPLKQAVEARGERLHVNLTYVDFDRAPNSVPGTLSHAQNPEEYAEFVAMYAERLKTRFGIVPDSFEMVLEPENSLGWSGQEIGRGMVAVEQRLSALGIHPEFVAPSTSNMENSFIYFDQMIQEPGVSSLVDVLSYHRYGGESDYAVQNILNRAQAHNVKTAMLEKIGAGIDVLLEDLTSLNVSSWQQWALAMKSSFVDKGAWYIQADMSNPANPAISMTKLTYHLAHVFKHVRRGATRIESQSSDSSVKTVAFMNTDGRYALVIRAPSTGGTATLGGLPDGTYGVWFTSSSNVTQNMPEVTVSAASQPTVTLPSSGTMTVYGKTASKSGETVPKPPVLHQ